MDAIDQTKKKMNAAIEHLKTDLRGLRTGRANPSMVEHVYVEVYGSKMRLQDLASVSTPEPRQLLITPYDANNLQAIAKGIETANLNLRPIVDGNVVRIKIPEMDAAVRQEMVKQGKKKTEDAKIVIRNIRRDANDQVKKSEAIPEDSKKKMEKQIQKLTDDSCKLAEDLMAEKEKEILQV